MQLEVGRVAEDLRDMSVQGTEQNIEVLVWFVVDEGCDEPLIAVGPDGDVVPEDASGRDLLQVRA